MRFVERAERQDDGPPSDEKIAAQMRSLAKVFVDLLASNGELLGWDVASALRLDGLCEELLWAFYEYMMTGRTAPDVKITPRDWSAPD